MRKNSEGDCRADVAPSCCLAKTPRQRRQEDTGSDGMGIRQKIEVDRVGRDPGVLDSEISEEDPEQLDELNSDEKGPEADSREFSFQRQCC
jgi:hypothetical protein